MFPFCEYGLYNEQCLVICFRILIWINEIFKDPYEYVVWVWLWVYVCCAVINMNIYVQCAFTIFTFKSLLLLLLTWGSRNNCKTSSLCSTVVATPLLLQLLLLHSLIFLQWRDLSVSNLSYLHFTLVVKCACISTNL